MHIIQNIIVSSDDTNDFISSSCTSVPYHTGHFVQPQDVVAICGGDIYSRRNPLFSSFDEHTIVCGSCLWRAVARPRHRLSVLWLRSVFGSEHTSDC